MSGLVGQHGVGPHRVGFVADQTLIDEVSARTAGARRPRAAAATVGRAGRCRVVGGNPDGALAAPAAVLSDRAVAQGATLGPEEAPRLGLADAGGQNRRAVVRVS